MFTPYQLLFLKSKVGLFIYELKNLPQVLDIRKNGAFYIVRDGAE